MQQLNDSFVINYNTLGVRGFSSAGYKEPTDLTYDEWANAGEVIKRIDRFKNFAIGDWLNVGEYRFGEMYSQAIDEFEWGDYNKLSKLKWVARSVPPANRRADLTWSHHHHIASLPPNEQIEWLEHAASYSLTASELNGAIKDKKQAAAIATRNELPPAPQAQPSTDEDTHPVRTMSPPSAYAPRNGYHATDDIDDRAEYLATAPDAYEDPDDVPFSHHSADCAACADLWPDERICAMVDAVACDVEYTDADGYTHTRQYVLAEDVQRLLRTVRDEFEAIR